MHRIDWRNAILASKRVTLMVDDQDRFRCFYAKRVLTTAQCKVSMASLMRFGGVVQYSDRCDVLKFWHVRRWEGGGVTQAL